ncbi:hypothetical protein [Nocardia sp. NRRL S-836]|uniref:hypothetical protein n=1 Tax=Nocardia sp. NRRL S-836 TaxID=1519492 RepID=UPI0006AFB029|nr:hypothetical protein [Nocardia sp. NRRL S-836]KOV87555.1 hypothetical protein ADL03_06525 [Nocardia sp. NRRL S-836]
MRRLLEGGGLAEVVAGGRPSLEITDLSDTDARKLVGVVDEQVLAEARGNPLALQELPKAGFGCRTRQSCNGFQSRLDESPAGRC